MKKLIVIGIISVLLAVGMGIFVEMAIQVEQYADEIEEIGPPGVTNVVLVAVVVLGATLICNLLIEYSNRKKQKKL